MATSLSVTKQQQRSPVLTFGDRRSDGEVTYDSSAWGGRVVQDSGMVQRRPDISGGVNGPSAFLYSFSSKLGLFPSCVAAANFLLLQRSPCSSCGDPPSPSTKEQ
nr:hypothetical protein Iba_chr14aCG7340 [Ipomoea batatas]